MARKESLVAKNQYTKATPKQYRGKTDFKSTSSYHEGTGKNYKTHERNTRFKTFNYSTRADGGDWHSQGNLKKGQKMFGKTAEVEGHYKTKDGKLSRRQQYYDVRKGMGLVGG